MPRRVKSGQAHLGPNPTSDYVVGIDMGASHLHFGLADLRGEVIKETAETIRPEDGPRKLIGQIKKGIRGLAIEAGFPTPSGQVRSEGHATRKGEPGGLRALALGVPGPVDPERGVVALANNLPGWKDVRLGQELEREFSVSVALENDANMAAIGEHWRGVAQGVDNFVFIALGTGIGSGVFVDGGLHRGRTGAAGELYLMNIEWRRWSDNFGDTGYFESHVSGLGIAAEGRKLLGPERQSKASRPGSPSLKYSNLRKDRDARFVFQALREGNPEARAILEKTFTMLGVGVVNIVTVLDPDLIVFGGGIVKGAPDLLVSTVEKVVRRIQPDPPRIMLSSLEGKAQTYGAIFSALTLAQDALARRVS